MLGAVLAVAGCSTPVAPPSTTSATSAPAGTAAPATAGDLPAPGRYTAEVTTAGGSGKAAIQSPASLTVTEAGITAVVTWSSPYYTWMEIDGRRYTPTSGQGEDATFEIPVVLDADIAVTAETTAMSQPHDIDYTIHFDSSSLKAAP